MVRKVIEAFLQKIEGLRRLEVKELRRDRAVGLERLAEGERLAKEGALSDTKVERELARATEDSRQRLPGRGLAEKFRTGKALRSKRQQLSVA